MARFIERKPSAKGDADFEANRQKLVQDVLDKIPQELLLPAKYIDKPPLDVTGIPAECGLLTPEELEITENYSLTDLVQAIASKKLTSVAVTKAFARRACIAHQLTFCLTELYMTEAIAQAEGLDQHLQTTGHVLGPLHGVPISIKEMVPVKDQLGSLGLMATRHIDEQDCLLVQILRDAGAVFYVKTHQPTAVFSMESMSALGRTLNPHNIDLAPGGSSGGEGALIAMKGSVLGVGTDIGGSIRIPAAYSGLYGLKGSHGFWPTEGLVAGPFAPGLQLHGVIGPMGRSLRDVDYVNRVVRGSKPWLRDPECLPVPYSGLGSKGEQKLLKIGILKDYGLVQPQPPAAKAIDWAQKQLEQAGFSTSPFDFFEPKRAHDLYCSVLVPDGWTAIDGILKSSGQPTPSILDKILKMVYASCDPEIATRGKEQPASVIALNRFKKDAYSSEFLHSWIEQGDPDIVIAPMSPACAHDTGLLEYNVSQTHLWNLLDYPGLVVPTPFKVEEKGKYSKAEYEDVPARGEWDSYAKEEWKRADFVGAPVALQILARRRMESELMEAVGRIGEALQLK